MLSRRPGFLVVKGHIRLRMHSLLSGSAITLILLTLLDCVGVSSREAPQRV